MRTPLITTSAVLAVLRYYAMRIPSSVAILSVMKSHCSRRPTRLIRLRLSSASVAVVAPLLLLHLLHCSRRHYCLPPLALGAIKLIHSRSCRSIRFRLRHSPFRELQILSRRVISRKIGTRKLAPCTQHEMDHDRGTLIVDRVSLEDELLSIEGNPFMA